MAKGKCSRCKKVLTEQNCSQSILVKGIGYCRDCESVRNSEAKKRTAGLSGEKETIGRCNKPLQTSDGRSRGFCIGIVNHYGVHGNGLCTSCGINIRPSRHSWCRECQEKSRRADGVGPRRVQVPGKLWVFSCGCKYILPKEGESNKFVVWSGSPRHEIFAHYCRIGKIIGSIGSIARKKGYKSVPVDTPHSIIVSMMEKEDCWLCCQSLCWEFGVGRTPCLHHDHVTGEPLGFTHPNCNLNEMITEINSLRKELLRLRKEVQESKIGEPSGDYNRECGESV